MISKEPPRKRVARACDRCRLKKGKCDGKEQCAKCVSADVMCIYTDRKPPQHKLISPAVAEALQSENLTLKKATIIIFKQLMQAQHGELPKISGVDWNSEKVGNGKSGRALNHIIQEAGVDNRISNEEILNYDSDTQMLEGGGRQAPDSPASRQSTPRHSPPAQSASSDTSYQYWNPSFENLQQPENQQLHAQFTKTRLSKHHTKTRVPQSPTAAPFIDPNLLQPGYENPPTPPTGFDSMDYLPAVPLDQQPDMQWADQSTQPRFFTNGLILQRYPENAAQPDQLPLDVYENAAGAQWGNTEYCQFMAPAEKFTRSNRRPINDFETIYNM